MNDNRIPIRLLINNLIGNTNKFTFSYIIHKHFNVFRFSSHHPQGIYLKQTYITQIDYQIKILVCFIISVLYTLG